MFFFPKPEDYPDVTLSPKDENGIVAVTSGLDDICKQSQALVRLSLPPCSYCFSSCWFGCSSSMCEVCELHLVCLLLDALINKVFLVMM